MELVVDERATGNTQQALGRFSSQRSQPGCQPAGQNGDLQPVHCMITLVPSKSNRNRTSSRPSSLMTRRTRAPSSQRNIKNPPPPAPISLPPKVPFSLANWYQWSIRSLLINDDRPFFCSQWAFINSPNCFRSPFSSASLISRPSCLTKCILEIMFASFFLLLTSCSL